MKNQFAVLFLALLMTMISGCEVIGGIFKAGVFVGVLAIVLVVGLIIFLVSKAGGKNK